MSFLVPSALVGLVLLAAPILIHLFRPRKTGRIPFSSLRWLKESSQEVSRRIEWHHWLLFLLRAGLLVMLVLALARPFFLGSDSSPPRDRIVILDQSRSMDYRAADQPTPWQRATELAAAAARSTRPGDRTAILAVDHRPRIVAPFSADCSAQAQSLRESLPSFADSRLDAALPVVQAMAANEQDRERPLELVLLSDFHQGSLSASEVQRFVAQIGRPLRVQIVPLGISGENGWIADARVLPPNQAGIRNVRVELGFAGDKPQRRTLRIIAPDANGAEIDVASPQAIQLTPGRETSVTIPLPPASELARGVCRLRLDPPDALTADDTFDLVADLAAPLKVVLLEPGKLGADGRPAGIHLRSAFEALEASGRQSLEIIPRTPATLAPADLEGADVVVAAGLPQLSAPLMEKLTARIRAGLGLAIFLGPDLPADAAWDSWHRPDAPGDSVLSRRWHSSLAEPIAPVHLTQADWQHPLLSALGDPQLGDLPRSQFARYARPAPAERLFETETILAKFPDGTPALIESPFGTGRVVVFNASANDAWGDMPLRRSFVPLMDRLLTHLSRRVGQRAFFVGEPVRLPLPAGFSADAIRLVSPEEKAIPIEIEQRAGRTWIVTLPLEAPGVYRLEPTDGAIVEPISFAARLGPGDRSLGAIDTQSLTASWSPAETEVRSPQEAADKFAAGSNSADGSPWLLLMAGLLLFTETLYGSWITPPRGADTAHPPLSGGAAP